MSGITVVTVTDKNTPFAYITVQLGIEEFARNKGYGFESYDKKTFYQRRLDPISDKSIVIIEAAYLEEGKFSVKELRKIFPNSKVVVLGSDTFFHISRGTVQFNGIADCDLFLDLMKSCAEHYSVYTKTDTWNWTTTKPLNDYLLKFAEENKEIVPDTDFISVLGKHTLENGYRKDMVEFIRGAGMTFTRGNSDGYNDPDMDKLYKSYLRSRYTLATSSHNNGMRSAKGFRNEVGIMLGRPLFTDNFVDSVKQYLPFGIFYDYYNLSELITLSHLYPFGSPAYYKLVEIQRKATIKNTIELQLERLLNKHGIT